MVSDGEYVEENVEKLVSDDDSERTDSDDVRKTTKKVTVMVTQAGKVTQCSIWQ